MFALGQNPISSTLSGINPSDYSSSVGNIISGNKNSGFDWLGLGITNKTPSEKATAAAQSPLDFSRWGAIIIGLILFIAGVFMLTHQTSISLVTNK